MADVSIKFLGDARQLTKTIAGIKQDAAGMGGPSSGFGRATAAMRGMALPALGAAAAVFKLASDAGDAADRLLDLEQITGISTDKLQEFENVAKEAGVSQEFYSESVLEVTKAMDRIERGTGPAAEALEKLNIATQNVDGSMRGAEEITDEVIAKLMGIEDASTRAALAEDIFKRKSQDLVAALALGEEGMDDAREAAHELGIVQSTEALESANEFRISMEELQTKLEAVSLEMLHELIPIIEDLLIPALGWMIDVVGNAKDGWDDFLDVITGKQELLHRIKSNIGEVNTELKTMERTAPETAAAFVENMDDAAAAVKSVADEMRAATDPAYALRRAEDAYIAAQGKVAELRKTGKVETLEGASAVADLNEAYEDLEHAEEQYNDAGPKLLKGLAANREELGLLQEEFDFFIASLENAGRTEIPIMINTRYGGGFEDWRERENARDTERDLDILNGARRRPR